MDSYASLFKIINESHPIFYQTIVIYGKPCIIPYLFTRIPQGSITQAALMALMKLHGWCYASEKEVTLRAISV